MGLIYSSNNIFKETLIYKRICSLNVFMIKYVIFINDFRMERIAFTPRESGIQDLMGSHYTPTRSFSTNLFL